MKQVLIVLAILMISGCTSMGSVDNCNTCPDEQSEFQLINDWLGEMYESEN